MKALFLTLTLACLFTAACGRPEDDLCDDRCDCEGCNEREFNDCLDRYDVRFVDADRRDCLDRYDDLLACEDDTAICRNYKWDTACKDEREALDRCVN
ncbi:MULTISPECIES: hypothetical protein [Sorangium]|uniref:Uncharacterized protein n=1 Tax=Sorangium cellulosum TaxID=56 RepID=A0A4P2QRZ7_SORCE|nr:MULTISPECIES: hypothetical protein [Sorangium]AUX32806.1 hypothetical protein SOCE836_049530 [Sorangium cellulosum]WCQ92183.1 hypothetical protein NQZ70_04919 [Sorangium sp. Soce836]